MFSTFSAISSATYSASSSSTPSLAPSPVSVSSPSNSLGAKPSPRFDIFREEESDPNILGCHVAFCVHLTSQQVAIFDTIYFVAKQNGNILYKTSQPSVVRTKFAFKMFYDIRHSGPEITFTFAKGNSSIEITQSFFAEQLASSEKAPISIKWDLASDPNAPRFRTTCVVDIKPYNLSTPQISSSYLNLLRYLDQLNVHIDANTEFLEVGDTNGVFRKVPCPFNNTNQVDTTGTPLGLSALTVSISNLLCPQSPTRDCTPNSAPDTFTTPFALIALIWRLSDNLSEANIEGVSNLELLTKYTRGPPDSLSNSFLTFSAPLSIPKGSKYKYRIDIFDLNVCPLSVESSMLCVDLNTKVGAITHATFEPQTLVGVESFSLKPSDLKLPAERSLISPKSELMIALDHPFVEPLDEISVHSLEASYDIIADMAVSASSATPDSAGLESEEKSDSMYLNMNSRIQNTLKAKNMMLKVEDLTPALPDNFDLTFNQRYKSVVRYVLSTVRLVNVRNLGLTRPVVALYAIPPNSDGVRDLKTGAAMTLLSETEVRDDKLSHDVLLGTIDFQQPLLSSSIRLSTLVELNTGRELWLQLIVFQCNADSSLTLVAHSAPFVESQFDNPVVPTFQMGTPSPAPSRHIRGHSRSGSSGGFSHRRTGSLTNSQATAEAANHRKFIDMELTYLPDPELTLRMVSQGCKIRLTLAEQQFYIAERDRDKTELIYTPNFKSAVCPASFSLVTDMLIPEFVDNSNHHLLDDDGFSEEDEEQDDEEGVGRGLSPETSVRRHGEEEFFHKDDPEYE